MSIVRKIRKIPLWLRVAFGGMILVAVLMGVSQAFIALNGSDPEPSYVPVPAEEVPEGVDPLFMREQAD